MTFKSEGWSTTKVEKQPQCSYMDEHGQAFIVRRESDYSWVAIAIQMKNFMCGQIIARGQSDMLCFDNALLEIIDNDQD